MYSIIDYRLSIDIYYVILLFSLLFDFLFFPFSLSIDIIRPLLYPPEPP